MKDSETDDGDMRACICVDTCGCVPWMCYRMVYGGAGLC